MANNSSLLLVGRTGNGKSSTGNSILGKKVFTPKSSSSSVTDDMSKGSAVIDGETIEVVDGPGLGDTGFDVPSDVHSAIDMARKALSMLVSGFYALLIVLKYGIRFTKQEKDAIEMIKSVYGEDVIKKHGIIVMTHGDSYELDMEDEGTPFESWCKQQGGDVQTLFQECGQRYVLFNNKTKDGGKMKEQYNKLMSHVKKLRSRQVPYTMDDFRRAEPCRTKLIVRSKLPELRKKTEDFVDRIERKAREIEDKPYLQPNGRANELRRLKDELDSFKQELQMEDHNTGLVNQILLQVSVTETSIRSKIDIHQRLADQQTLQSEMRRSRERLNQDIGYSRDTDGSKDGELNPQKVVILILLLLAVILLIYICFSALFGSGSPPPGFDESVHQGA